MLLSDQRDRLIDLGKKVNDRGLPELALRDSVFELTYILLRIKELAPDLEIDTNSDSQSELNRYFESSKALRFYSQCLLLWGCRILELLDTMSNIEIPTSLKLARHILAAHYGTADGSLKSKLIKEQGFIVSPTFSRGGNFQYVIGSLGSPASTASPSELELIRKLFKKYCPQEQDFNWWKACYKILHQNAHDVNEEDMKQIEKFIRNNGGIITDSKNVIECVINSLEKHLTTNIE